MRSNIRERSIEVGQYIAENQCTVRKATEVFKISKSTVHKDVTERLRYENIALYQEVKAVLRINKAQRHLRGGEATKRKFMKENSRKIS